MIQISEDAGSLSRFFAELDKKIPELGKLWQNRYVARGWESKAVEEQVESAAVKKAEPASKGGAPEQQARQRELEGLQLSRVRIVRELETATHPRHREQLSAALKFLDNKIAELS